MSQVNCIIHGVCVVCVCVCVCVCVRACVRACVCVRMCGIGVGLIVLYGGVLITIVQ